MNAGALGGFVERGIMHSNSETLIARSIRLAVIQDQYEHGNITEAEAKELLTLPLTPGDNSTIFDDSDQLMIKLIVCESGSQNCKYGNASLSHHDWHCPKCDVHLTSLYACPECGTRYNPPNKRMQATPQARLFTE